LTSCGEQGFQVAVRNGLLRKCARTPSAQKDLFAGEIGCPVLDSIEILNHDSLLLDSGDELLGHWCQ
jgi:hypothetical protein